MTDTAQANAPGERQQQERRHRPYGLWDSPIGPDIIAQGIGLQDVAFDPQTGRLVWHESRGGRGVLVTADPAGGAPNDLTVELDVRAQVGYGGGAFTAAIGCAFFVARDGRLYRQPLEGGLARPLTPPFGFAASPAVSPDGRWVVYVHSDGHDDCLAVVDSQGRQWPQKLVHGADFYMQPCWHPGGRHLAYIAWNHPNMPWDGTTLYLAELAEAGDTLQAAAVTPLGGGERISVFQPAFSPDGRWLAYVSDESGWWQIYLYDMETGRRRQVTDVPAEHGRPAWVQGMRTYSWAPDSRAIFYVRNETGFHSLWRYDLESGVHARVTGDGDEYTVYEQICVESDRRPALSGTGPQVLLAYIASGPRIPRRIVLRHVLGAGRSPGEAAGAGTVAAEAGAAVAGAGTAAAGAVAPGAAAAGAAAPGAAEAVGPGTSETVASVAAQADDPRPPRVLASYEVLRRSMAETLPPEVLSEPQAIQWSAPDGTTVHGLYYPPANPRFVASGLPPAIINIHGGPTSQSLPEFEPRAQFFTSRGYAYVAVNYRGSTGYGRAYRDALKGRWGVADVQDAIGAGRYLAEAGLADGDGLVIMGGSAGGYTVLQALSLHPGFFRAGLCLFGISNLFTLAADTHKFEARYLDSLVGPLPEAAAVYRERSPLFHADRIRDPVAVFQGTDDKVVPKEQADAIVAALRSRGVPHEYHVYEGEGHGWRKPETIAAFWQAVDAFLRRYVIFA